MNDELYKKLIELISIYTGVGVGVILLIIAFLLSGVILLLYFADKKDKQTIDERIKKYLDKGK